MNKFFKENNQVDERERMIFMEIMGVAGFIAYIYGIVFTLIKLITTREWKSASVEIGLLLIMTFTIFIGRMIHRDFDIPKTITSKVLPTGKSREEKMARFTYYIKDALRFSIGWTLISYIWKGEAGTLFSFEKIYLSYLADALISFILFTILNYIWYEYNVKRYNKYMASLDQDPEDYNDDE